jgi:3-hydroxyethyl bacteriochlorophyllide a dehydrogenase
MEAVAVVLDAPERLGLKRLGLNAPGAGDVVVETLYSGVSTGTERLLWAGKMPAFPGMGYPLVPGYEAVGRVAAAWPNAEVSEGALVFVPGASCYDGARGLFGASASRIVTSSWRVIPLSEDLGEAGVLFALAATAAHAIAGGPAPDLIIGHGVLGRLIARVMLAQGHPAPTVWEINPARQDGGLGYPVLGPDADPRRDYHAIMDASGALGVLDMAIARLAPGGEVCLAGFYDQPLSFQFAPAFMREAKIRIAAEFKPADLAEIRRLTAGGALSLGGLITHRSPADNAASAYRTAFEDASCLKMVLDWRGAHP